MLLFLSFGATAQTLSTNTFSSGNGNLPAVGSNFAVPIDVTGIGTIFTLTVCIEYDPEIMEYTGMQNAQTTTFVSNQTTSVLKILVGNFPAPTTITDGLLVDLMFEYYGGDGDLTFHTWEYGTYKSSILETTYITTYFYDADVTNGSITSGVVNNTITGGDWNTASNWSLGVVPNTWHNVAVESGAKGEVTIDAAAVADGVYIYSGGQLTLNSTLTVDGNFRIGSDGSFIDNGTLTVGGSLFANRYFGATNWSTQLDGWHLLSSPMTSMNINPNFTQGTYDFYRWDEPSVTWENYKAGHAGFTSFEVGRGYLVAYETAGNRKFEGSAFNKTNVTKNGLTNSGAADPYGWNLLGNPFPSAVTWNDGNWSLNNVAGTAKIWQETASSYVDIIEDAVIPAMNGFMVYVGTNPGSLIIPAASRTHSGTPWYKSQDQMITLVAHDLDIENLAQNSIIRFNADATTAYDLEFDSYFLAGYAPMLYSVADGDAYLSLNTLPEFNKDLVVPFMFQKNQSSNFSIALAEGMEGVDVLLKDKKTNTVVNLNSGPYVFSSEEGDDASRFEIMFGYVGIDNPSLNTAHVYSNGNSIVVANVNGYTEMGIINIQGQEIGQHSFNSTGLTSINVELPTGIYFVRLTNNGDVKTAKVYVK